MDQKPTDNIGLAPFSCTFSSQLPELLFKLKCSIAISTYQANKIVFISPVDENKLTQLPRDFTKPIYFEIYGDKMILTTNDEVIFYKILKKLEKYYVKKKDT